MNTTIEDLTVLEAQHPNLDFFFSNGQLNVSRNYWQGMEGI